MNINLSDRLKAATKTIHRRVESTPYVQAFIKGGLARADYVLHMQRLHRVYAELESVLPECRELRSFPWSELARAAPIGADLAALGSFETRDLDSNATAAYVDRIGVLAQTRPLHLVAHAYVRYLGDLSGGQILAKLAQTRLGLREDQCAFYRFPRSTADLKQDFRRCLDDLPVSAHEGQEIIEEAIRAFELNQAVFLEIQPANSTAAPKSPKTTNEAAAQAAARAG